MAMQLGGGGKDAAIAPQVNVTPLVDVALVVLIIFMVVTPLLTRQIHLHLPSEEASASPPPDVKDEPLVVSVDREGTVRLGRDVVTDDELARRLPRAIAASRSKVVHFDAHDELPYERAVAVVDRARGAGATKIAIVTKPLTR